MNESAWNETLGAREVLRQLVRAMEDALEQSDGLCLDDAADLATLQHRLEVALRDEMRRLQWRGYRVVAPALRRELDNGTGEEMRP
jgi:hypothetical protein